MLVQAEQQLLRRAAVTLHLEECGWEEDQSATQIHKKGRTTGTIVKKRKLIMQYAVLACGPQG